MVNVVMVFFILHHLLQVMVISYTNLYSVRVCLTKICLSVVSQIVIVLIPVEWV